MKALSANKRAKTVARSLDELRAVKKEIDHAAREQAQALAIERERLKRLAQEQQLFAHSVGPVQPLRREAAEPPPRPLPQPEARQRQRDEAAVLQEAISDEFDVESLLDTDEGLSFRRFDISPEVVKKLRRGVWAIQADIDLHGLRREEARERLGAFMREAVRQGLRCIRVVHGKGHGSPGREPVLKAKVKTWLAQKNDVLAYTHARACDGGHGALVVLLRPAAGSPPAPSPQPPSAKG